MKDQQRVRLTKPPKQRKSPAPANRKHFTEGNVLKFAPKKGKQYLVWDKGTGAARGLAVLVSPTGTASYRVVYYFKGSAKPHWMHLGRVGEMKLEQARELTRVARKQASDGIDSKADDPSKAHSFQTAVEDYIADEQKGRHKNKSADVTQALMLRACDEWKPRSAATLRYQEIDHLLCSIRDGNEAKGIKKRPYLANRLYSHLKDFFGWCVRKRKIESNPMFGMEQPLAKVESRNRTWFRKQEGDKAIQALWSAADEIGGQEGKYVKIMLLTGKRKTALAQMRWEEIGPDWFWDAPPSDSNKKLHGVPFSKLAQRVLGTRQHEGKVFGELNLGRLQGKVRAASGIKDFFWHGIRHLAETKCAELKDGDRSLILPHVRDLLFDHVFDRGAGKGYDHHDYKPEMRTAAEQWAAYVEKLVTPPGVSLVAA
jgi:integrase